jgi:hypothetical protein
MQEFRFVYGVLNFWSDTAKLTGTFLKWFKLTGAFFILFKLTSTFFLWFKLTGTFFMWLTLTCAGCPIYRVPDYGNFAT